MKKAHLRRCLALALAAAYLQYAWTHRRWVPRPSARRLDLFEQPAGSGIVSSLKGMANEQIPMAN